MKRCTPLTNPPRILMHSGREEGGSSSPRSSLSSSVIVRLLSPALPLALPVNEEKSNSTCSISRRSLIPTRNRHPHSRSRHAADPPTSGYYCEQFGSATGANVNITSSVFSRREKSDVLHKLKQLLSIRFPPVGTQVITQVHEHSPCNIISNTSYFKRISYIESGQSGKAEEKKNSEKKSCRVSEDESDEKVWEDNPPNRNHPVTTSSCCIDSSSIGDFIKKYLFRKVFVFAVCSGDATDQTISIGSVKNAYKSSSEINPAIRIERNSHKQSSTSTTVSSSFVEGTSATVSGKVENVFSSPDIKMKEEKQLEFILKSLVAGGVAGMCAKTAVAPLDRMKILLQAHSKHYSHLGVFSGLRGIVLKERAIALYKGNGAQMVRIFPYAATQFTSFEMYKKFLGEDSHVARFAAGSLAGVTAVALTYPLDTIRARLAFQVTGEHVYSGIYSCALHIFREEGGVRALYRGFVPTLCGMVPYAGLSFYCFESFKYLCMKYLPMYTCKSHSTNTGGLVLLLYAKLICGGVAGAAAQTVAYPLDVTRRRMQLAMMDEKTKKFGMGMVSTIKLIYKENGVIRGLYRGMSINYLRAIPMVAVSFSTYELVKQTLSLDTGLSIKTG